VIRGTPDHVELRELRIFLVLAEELHFGRTAERLGMAQSAVSQAIRLLERRLGARLFDRSSRRVQLTPAGTDLQKKLTPLIESLGRVLADVRDESHGVAGVLRLGATFTTTLLPPVYLLAKAFQARYPRCVVHLRTVSIEDPYPALRRGEVDVEVNWLAVDEPGLTAGPAIAHYDRVVVVAPDHRLAKRESVSVEELADETFAEPPGTLPAAIVDAILLPKTPGGRVLRRLAPGDADVPAWTFGTLLAGIGRGEIVQLTMRDQIAFLANGLVVVPVHDLPPVPLGLIWRTAAEDAKIRALAEVARSEGPWPTDGHLPA
jgi:DNA-binding transcriptional LysR family regulator